MDIVRGRKCVIITPERCILFGGTSAQKQQQTQYGKEIYSILSSQFRAPFSFLFIELIFLEKIAFRGLFS